MESSTEASKIQENAIEPSAVVVNSNEKVKIEDCSDDSSDLNELTVVVNLPAKNVPVAEEQESVSGEIETAVIVEEVEVDGEVETNESGSTPVEVAQIVHKMETVNIGGGEEQSPIATNDVVKVAEITVTTNSPTPATTTPVAAKLADITTEGAHKVVQNCEIVEQQGEIEKEETAYEQVVDGKNEAPAAVAAVAEDKQIAAEGGATETKVTPGETVSSTSVAHSAEKSEMAPTSGQPVAEQLSEQQQQKTEQAKPEKWNNTIKEIISDIDLNIEEQENIALLKQQQKELLQKQQELAQQIRQQQLYSENRLQQQKQAQQQQQKQQEQQQQQQPAQQLHSQPHPQEIQQIPIQYEQQSKFTPFQPQEHFSKYSTFEEAQNEHGYTRKTETYESKESSNTTKHIDLHKIFTPATDAEEILPRNRKLYASSAFYSPTLHPTVEDQVELARRISHSLSDISNQKSKGQSMYVNRKKRSVKWVHEGAGQDVSVQEQEEFKENSITHNEPTAEKSTLNQIPLRLLMNPRGKIRDITSISESLNTGTGLMSPDKCAELVTALQTQKGKGAELFAKRRRKSEKWVVDETNTGTESPSGLPDYHQYQVRPSTSPSILPAYSDAGKHRVQLNIQQEQLLEKYAKPGLKVVKTPWEAALESGSASMAFVEETKPSAHQTPTPTASPAPALQYQYSGRTAPDGVTYNDSYAADSSIPSLHKLPQAHFPTSKPIIGSAPHRDLAYKPSLPQGWKSPGVTLPKELYLPKEISLESYAPPPVVNIKEPAAFKNSCKLTSPPSPIPSSFPVGKPNSGGFLGYGTTPPPKQQYLEPSSYRTVPQETIQTVPQISYNPSPLPYDKIAKFENAAEQQPPNYDYSPSYRRLAVQSHGAKVRNASPTPFGGGAGSACYAPATAAVCGNYSGAQLSPSPYSTSNDNGKNVYDRATTPVNTKRLGTNELLHAQNYNNTARGWRSSTSGGYPSPCGVAYGGRDASNYGGLQRKALTAANNLPYTDF